MERSITTSLAQITPRIPDFTSSGYPKYSHPQIKDNPLPTMLFLLLGYCLRYFTFQPSLYTRSYNCLSEPRNCVLPLFSPHVIASHQVLWTGPQINPPLCPWFSMPTATLTLPSLGSFHRSSCLHSCFFWSISIWATVLDCLILIKGVFYR